MGELIIELPFEVRRRFRITDAKAAADVIEKLEKLKGAEINEAKKILANEATKLCHGDRAAKQALETAKTTFEQGGVVE